jgi:hypothetical protein
MAALNVPSAVNRDGKVLESLVGSGVQLQVLEGSEQAAEAAATEGLTSSEEEEIEGHLRGLGYVE